MILRYICTIFFFICVAYITFSSAGKTEVPTTTPTTQVPSPTPTPQPECKTLSATCEECVKYPKCIYCYHGKNGTCLDYPTKDIIPRAKDCNLGDTRWGTCALNYKALLIAMGTVAGLILFTCFGCVCYCCYCRGPSGRKQRKWAKEDAKEQRKKEERQMKNAQKKAERQAKNDEIRRKYGLSKDDDGQYHRMEEED